MLIYIYILSLQIHKTIQLYPNGHPPTSQGTNTGTPFTHGVPGFILAFSGDRVVLVIQYTSSRS